MSSDARTGHILLFGGLGQKAMLTDTWLWDGNTWKESHPALAPSGRAGAALAYDQARGSAVLFGGRDANGKVLGDTWIWDGKIWREAPSPNAPSARALPAMAYHSARAEVILFGGSDSQDRQLHYLGDTWQWNGSEWKEAQTTDSPIARAGAAMAYHANTGRLLLFGGGNGGQLNDTWTWDGTWSEQRPSLLPPARSSAAFAEDRHGQRVFLFGGWSGTAEMPILNDSWTWDGVAWTEERPAVYPPPTFGANMAHDGTQLILVRSQGSKRQLQAEKWSWK